MTGRCALSFGLAVVAFFVFVLAIPQDQSFHHFADDRTLAGLPNFWNVFSNLPFLLVWLAGCIRAEGIPQRVMFAGVLLTALGSSDYHFSPDDARLVWDRLPWLVVGLFGVAQLLEVWDIPIYQHLGVSGHMLKHLTAGLATYCLYLWETAAAKTPQRMVKT